jgi:hypothetical protein
LCRHEVVPLLRICREIEQILLELTGVVQEMNFMSPMRTALWSFSARFPEERPRWRAVPSELQNVDPVEGA